MKGSVSAPFLWFRTRAIAVTRKVSITRIVVGCSRVAFFSGILSSVAAPDDIAGAFTACRAMRIASAGIARPFAFFAGLVDCSVAAIGGIFIRNALAICTTNFVRIASASRRIAFFPWIVHAVAAKIVVIDGNVFASSCANTGCFANIAGIRVVVITLGIAGTLVCLAGSVFSRFWTTRISFKGTIGLFIANRYRFANTVFANPFRAIVIGCTGFVASFYCRVTRWNVGAFSAFGAVFSFFTIGLIVTRNIVAYFDGWIAFGWLAGAVDAFALGTITGSGAGVNDTGSVFCTVSLFAFAGIGHVIVIANDSKRVSAGAFTIEFARDLGLCRASAGICVGDDAP